MALRSEHNEVGDVNAATFAFSQVTKYGLTWLFYLVLMTGLVYWKPQKAKTGSRRAQSFAA